MKIKLSKIKEYLNSKLINIDTNISSDYEFNNLSSISNSINGDITFYHNYNYKNDLKNTKASACLIKEDDKLLLPKNCEPILVANPYESFAHLTHIFNEFTQTNFIISKNAIIDDSLELENDTSIGNFVVIKNNTYIGDKSIIFDNSVIGPNVKIGRNTCIYPNCHISNSVIGNNCVIQSGTVIGDSGFGFLSNDKTEIKHVGNVIIGNNTYIGSNVTIDKATLDSTIIGNNVRIDNLVQIAHNVQIGNNTIIASQSGVAGGSIIGSDCKLAGQVGVSGHLTIGDNVTIAGKSGVTKNINSNAIIAGFPAIDINDWKKSIIKQYKK
tara:strand:- start:817 stop:1794 length:978 start_codon:yes stop_codon:yes gene_type:complete